jgi:hypothetical protein
VAIGIAQRRTTIRPQVDPLAEQPQDVAVDSDKPGSTVEPHQEHRDVAAANDRLRVGPHRVEVDPVEVACHPTAAV